MRRRHKAVLITLGILLSPLLLAAGCFTGVVLLNSFNPFQLMFLDSFEIVNRSGQDGWAPPIGMREGSGKCGPLPRFYNRYPPAVPHPTRSNLLIPKGETLKYTYGWDDFNFRHLLVRNTSGEVFIVDTDKEGTLHQCYRPPAGLVRNPAPSHPAPSPSGAAALPAREICPLLRDEGVSRNQPVTRDTPRRPTGRMSFPMLSEPSVVKI